MTKRRCDFLSPKTESIQRFPDLDPIRQGRLLQLTADTLPQVMDLLGASFAPKQSVIAVDTRQGLIHQYGGESGWFSPARPTAMSPGSTRRRTSRQLYREALGSK